MKLILACGLLLAGALLAGCESTDTGPVTPAMQDGAYVIHLVAGNHFSPANAKVPLNATVKWVVDDGVHDVSRVDGPTGGWTQDSPRAMQPNTSFTQTFAVAGTYHYECTIHSATGMKGTLVVG